MEYCEFLKENYGREPSTVGDFARVVEMDDTFPRPASRLDLSLAEQYQTINTYLVHLGTMPMYMKAFQMTWNEYEQNSKASKNMPKWTRTVDRLPDKSQDGKMFIVTCQKGDNTSSRITTIAMFMVYDEDTSLFSINGNKFHSGDVVAWMPLPAPYRGER